MHAWMRSRRSVCTQDPPPPPPPLLKGEDANSEKRVCISPFGSNPARNPWKFISIYADDIGTRAGCRRAKGLGLRDVSLIHPNCVPKLDLLQRPICSRRRIIDKARGGPASTARKRPADIIPQARLLLLFLFASSPPIPSPFSSLLHENWNYSRRVIQRNCARLLLLLSM